MTHLTRFALDTKNDKLAGVCSGLANYFDIDVTLIRVAFVFSVFVTGWTLLLYFILAIVAPDDYELK